MPIEKITSEEKRLTLSGVPEGFDALITGDLVRARGRVMHIARDDARLRAMADALAFFAPDISVLRFPAWDCQPYDRVSPKPEVSSERVATLSALSKHANDSEPLLLLTTVNAVLQRVPTRETVSSAVFSAAMGNILDTETLMPFLQRTGYTRSGTVMEPGEFAVRGGLIDIFPPGAAEPLRLDLFGDTLESVRTFNPETQRTTAQLHRLDLVPASEVLVEPQSIAGFRSGYVKAFGTVTDDDPLYEAVSAGRKYPGMEHWLPLFYPSLETVFDYLPDALVVQDPLMDEAAASRLELIQEYYEARVATQDTKSFAAPAYKPLAPEQLYLSSEEWAHALSERQVRSLNPFQAPESAETLDLGGKLGRNFSPERSQEGANVFDALVAHVEALSKRGKQVLVACWSDGARERLMGLLSDHGLQDTYAVESWADALALPRGTVAVGVVGLDTGFETETLAVIAEQDILGDRLVRPRRDARRAANFLTEASSLSPGDYVVHVDHGIGQFSDLHTIDVAGAPHDCLLILYHGGDKLYLPVENIELLSRYGSDDTEVQLDRLGGSGWQARKAKAKERIREIAEELIKVAAARELNVAQPLELQTGLYDEFCARFPFEETEDQLRAISEVVEDLGSGRPMDRLVCGDVGFGKTEVALRSAFVAAMTGRQVAVVVPTTLLSRQHFETFVTRFAGWPVQIRQLSRMVPTKEAAETREGLASGAVDIVIGTHSLLGKRIKFRDLGLLIIDEEQHFGVVHKERLKKLRADIHVLTLTATPIPRTLQLALTGVRDLSIIATPPVDRLAVRTFVSPFDQVVVREALLREHYRGGQSFYVCPRIADLPEAAEFLRDSVPEVKFAIAHGQMAAMRLDEIMTAFYEGRYDVLLCTTIIESGLDVPTANTLVVHRADMFGLAQLYQLRGRIGRSKARAYAYLTVPPRRKLTDSAEKRLKVLQSLDALGAGFTMASHDLDIRGAGNLLGDEQSGHIREVGFELYQEMLEEAVAGLRGGNLTEVEGQWSPQIHVGIAVLIPERYVPDLDVRLGLYRRLARIETRPEIDAFAAELIDRFGALPEEVEHLLKVVEIKGGCLIAGIEKIEAGPKGATLNFRGNEFANPAGLVGFINAEGGHAKLRPDHTLVYLRKWDTPADRLRATHKLVDKLVEIAQAAPVSA